MGTRRADNPCPWSGGNSTIRSAFKAGEEDGHKTGRSGYKNQLHLEEVKEHCSVRTKTQRVMAQTDVDDRPLNKWGVRNILRSAWKEYGEVQVNWVKDNTFVIIVRDEEVATRILDQVPWAVMKKNLSVKRWKADLALEEVEMHRVPFWVQLKGIPLNLSSDVKVRKLAGEIGEVVDVEDLARGRGFLRVQVIFDTSNPLPTGCWLARNGVRDSWVEFQYERLQDFCYRCGRIGHESNEYSFPPISGNFAGNGEWIRTKMVRDVPEIERSVVVPHGQRRCAGETRERRNIGSMVGGSTTPRIGPAEPD